MPNSREGRDGGGTSIQTVPKSTPQKQRAELRSQEQSPLMSLPAELRNEIYKMSFAGCIIHMPAKTSESSSLPGLLLACKQTYIKAIDICYATSTFHFR